MDGVQLPDPDALGEARTELPPNEMRARLRRAGVWDDDEDADEHRPATRRDHDRYSQSVDQPSYTELLRLSTGGEGTMEHQERPRGRDTSRVTGEELMSGMREAMLDGV
jgi:hypothetical protein